MWRLQHCVVEAASTTLHNVVASPASSRSLHHAALQAAKRSLESLTIGPVLTWTTARLLDESAVLAAPQLASLAS